MALPSHTALASLDVGHCYAPQLRQMFCLQTAFGKHKHGHVLSRGRSRRCVQVAADLSSTASSSVATAAPKSDGDKCLEMRTKIRQDKIGNRPFKIAVVDTGGEKDWHSAVVTTVQDLAPGIRSITVETECSREMVSLSNAYTKPGQLAQVKVNGGNVLKLAVSCPPFSKEMNDPVLYKLRGDIPSGMTKQPQSFFSVTAPLQLLVFEADTPSVFSLKEGDTLEVGPFDKSGLDLRPILFLARFPTILLFASGKGIAVAKSIIEAKDADVGSLSLGQREDIRLFYWEPEPSRVLFKDLFNNWENKRLKVRPAVRTLSGGEWNGHVGSFLSLWDGDDIEYDPECTAVVVCVESKLRDEVEELLADAGITEKHILRYEF